MVVVRRVRRSKRRIRWLSRSQKYRPAVRPEDHAVRIVDLLIRKARRAGAEASRERRRPRPTRLKAGIPTIAEEGVRRIFTAALCQALAHFLDVAVEDEQAVRVGGAGIREFVRLPFASFTRSTLAR